MIYKNIRGSKITEEKILDGYTAEIFEIFISPDL